MSLLSSLIGFFFQKAPTFLSKVKKKPQLIFKVLGYCIFFIQVFECVNVFGFNYKQYMYNSADSPIFAEILAFNIVNELFTPSTIYQVQHKIVFDFFYM